LLVATACEPAAESPPATVDPQEVFWTALTALCGQAFEGSVQDPQPQDTAFAGRTLVMHVRECTQDEIRIPFHVDDDRSRTWVLTRTETGLRLKHDHRHADGSEDEVTQYGGDTSDSGTATQQSFPADQETATLLPAAATNVWTMELEPATRFAYTLRREGTDRRFRVEFDLTRTVPAPPPPWGAPSPPDSPAVLPGEPVDIGPREGDRLAVVGIVHDDVLRLHAAPGEGQEVLTTVEPTHAGLIAQGQTRSVPGAFWTLVDRDGTLGWVNMRSVAYIGDTYDHTADRLLALDGRPFAPTMTDLGRIVAESMRSPDAEPIPRIVVVDDETVGDLGEVTLDLIGLADDSLRGYRVHVFGEPVDGGFVLRTVEVTNLCARGVGAEGLSSRAPSRPCV
jgi:hypothetical protein